MKESSRERLERGGSWKESLCGCKFEERDRTRKIEMEKAAGEASARGEAVG